MIFLSFVHRNEWHIKKIRLYPSNYIYHNIEHVSSLVVKRCKKKKKERKGEKVKR